MKVAVCMSGQPRTWETCYESWRALLAQYDTIDFFCYMWDYNSPPQHGDMLGNLSEIAITNEEQQRFIEKINPKRISFQSKKSFPIQNGVKKPLIPYEHMRSQFYGLWQASLLKRTYELENNIEYDVVLRIRPDTYFPKQMNVIPTIKPSTIYFQQYQDLSKFYGTSPNQLAFSDQFFMADSQTFDKFAQFYCEMDYLDEDDIFPAEYKKPDPITPEWIIGYYATLRNIPIAILKNNILVLIRRGKDYPGKLQRGEIL